MLCQRKWLFLRKPLGDNSRAGVYTGSSAKSALEERAERGGQEVIKHQTPSEIRQNMPSTGNPVPKLCSCSCLSQDITRVLGFTSHSWAALGGWGWDREEELMSLVLTVQPYFWLAISYIHFPQIKSVLPLKLVRDLLSLSQPVSFPSLFLSCLLRRWWEQLGMQGEPAMLSSAVLAASLKLATIDHSHLKDILLPHIIPLFSQCLWGESS